ncbi:MAG: hypothetical protein JNK05_09495 [Myxococcales bacterium]|nr:hypothetical protein [Myxococcales bacterium]
MSIPLSNEDRDALAKELVAKFPSAKATPSVVDAYAIALNAMGQSSVVDLAKYKPALDAAAQSVGLTKDDTVNGPTLVVPAATSNDASARYYNAAATHDREIPDLGTFTGHLWMARVTLPKSTPVNARTAVGSVEAGDHLIACVDEMQAKYGGLLSKPVDRVDVITPARLCGARFGAISVYLGYFKGDNAPDFYVLEAGTALGDARVLYLASGMDQRIVRYSGYQPTPFAAPKHIYVGRLTMMGDSPDTLRVSVHKDTSSLPYMKLTVSFTESAPPSHPEWPGFLLLRALGIVLSRLGKVPLGQNS